MKTHANIPFPPGAGLTDRRSFLRRTGGILAASGAVASTLAPPWLHAVAGPLEAGDFESLVPRDKRLSDAWLKSLVARGVPTTVEKADSRHIGMPIGGIGCGQLYLGGDGRLWLWDISNQAPPPDFSDYRGPHYAKPLKAESPLDQGFGLRLAWEGRAVVRDLDRRGFERVRFQGQYPVGRVEYRDGALPVEVDLEAWSPFIPLAVEDSSLPATVMEFTVRNTGGQAVEVDVLGWQENGTCLTSGRPGRGSRTQRVRREEGWMVLDQRVVAAPVEPAKDPRPDVVFDDFERAGHEPWKATGTAFGGGPVELSRVPEYQGNLNAQGGRVVNSHAAAPAQEVGARDAATGTLTGPEFVVVRNYINFRIGGGSHKDRTCLNLEVDGKTVLSTTGENNNRMRVRTWDVRAWAGRTARLKLVDAESGPWGHVGLDEVVFSDVPREGQTPLEQEEDFGSMALGLLGREGGDHASVDGGGAGHDLEQRFVAGRTTTPTAAEAEARTPFGGRQTGSLGRRFWLGPGEARRVTFVVAWYFPSVRRESLAHVTGIAGLQRAYGKRFASAADVAGYVAREFDRLSGATKLWRRTWYDDSTLPHWFLERTFANTSILATATCLQFDNGRFYGWEGTYCCAGTCQHVWQYAQSVGRVFPALERSVREMVDYGLAFRPETGGIDYRAEAHRVVAIDGLTGTILRAYREHQMSADDAFLGRIWPRVRRSVEHLLGRDPDGNGILDGEQYNTLDASWYGEIAWLSSMYCAALRAGAAMARETGDAAFAERCDRVADEGARRITERLFNGEYYVQKVDPAHPESINTNDGCHIDQVFGQSWAHQVGLSRVLPPGETRKALESLWRYNFTPDVGVYRDRFKALRGGRWYAMPGEGGLLMCTWPRGGGEKAAGKGDPTFVGYFNECMTGFEYQVAAHMVWEGMVEQGLAITRMIHDRYAPAKRNPYNEVECSSHYSRAMASHGVYLAACGFECHGPKGRLSFSPRFPGRSFRAAFVAAEGWGSFTQEPGEGGRGTRVELDVRWGRVSLRELGLNLPAGEGRAVVRRGAVEIPVRLERRGDRAVLVFAEPVVLGAGERLEVRSVG